MKVAYLLVTCSREKTRDTMLKKVVESLKSLPAWETWKEDFYVFDNASTYENTQTELMSSFEKVILSEENYGYWSAVNWFTNFAQNKEYDYVYIMESDCVHYNIDQLNDGIKLMELEPELGMLRAAEFSLKNKHLYDKARRHPDSITSEWFTQSNYFTKEPATYEYTKVPGALKTNLVAKVCGLHRVLSLKEVLSQLVGWFIEVDFQRFYHEKHPFNAILDGGIYNSTAAYEPNVIAGSLVKEAVDENGYRKTREGFITPIEEMRIK